MPDWLTLSGEFVSIWSIRVAVWSVGLVIICSRECVKQSSKYDLVRLGISLLIVFAGWCLKISWSLGCKFMLTKLYLSGGLYKIPIRTCLDLGRKIFRKILSVLMQKLGFRLYEIEFLTKQATPLPLRNRLDLTRSYPYPLFQVHCSKLCCQV